MGLGNCTVQFSVVLNSQKSVMLRGVCGAACLLQGWEGKGVVLVLSNRRSVQDAAGLLHGKAAPAWSGCLCCPLRGCLGLVDVSRLAAFQQNCDGRRRGSL